MTIGSKSEFFYLQSLFQFWIIKNCEVNVQLLDECLKIVLWMKAIWKVVNYLDKMAKPMIFHSFQFSISKIHFINKTFINVCQFESRKNKKIKWTIVRSSEMQNSFLCCHCHICSGQKWTNQVKKMYIQMLDVLHYLFFISNAIQK